MADIGDDLKATNDSLIEDAQRLEALELQKSGMAPDDPDLQRVSAEAEILGRAIARKTAAESLLAAEAARDA